MAFKTHKKTDSNQKTNCVLQRTRRAYSNNVFRKRSYIADFGSSCSRGLGHLFLHLQQWTTQSNIHNATMTLHDGNNWRRIELTRCWRNMSKQQYKYRLAICICLKMWNELLPMHIMNDTCTQLHMMRVVFFNATHDAVCVSFKGQGACWARLEAWSWNVQAHLAPLTSPSPSPYVFDIMHLHRRQDARSGDPKCVPANI